GVGYSHVCPPTDCAAIGGEPTLIGDRLGGARAAGRRWSPTASARRRPRGTSPPSGSVPAARARVWPTRTTRCSWRPGYSQDASGRTDRFGVACRSAARCPGWGHPRPANPQPRASILVVLLDGLPTPAHEDSE